MVHLKDGLEPMVDPYELGFDLSLYFSLIWLVIKVFGLSALSLRLPSSRTVARPWCWQAGGARADREDASCRPRSCSRFIPCGLP